MHFLPWIFSLLFIYSLVSTFLLDHHKTTALSTLVLDEAFHLDQKIEERRAKNHFLAVTKNRPKKESTTEKKDQKEISKPKISHRLTNYRNSTAKIHLLSFLNSDDPSRLEALIRCLDLYYSAHRPFSEYKGSMSRDMALAFEQKVKLFLIEKKKFTLIDLMPDNPKLAKLFLLMLEGCPGYSFQSNQLFPALGEIFFINPAQSTIGFFPDLPYPTLVALFSRNFADELIEKETARLQDSSKGVSKEEILDLLKTNGIILADPSIYQFQGKPIPSKEIVVHDAEHRMTYVYTP